MEPDNAAQKDRGPETILVIEDEEGARSLCEDVLSGSGYNVFSVEDGREGLELFTRMQGSIDLVILDLMLPGMGGDQLLEEMIKLDPDVKILLSSGYCERKSLDVLGSKIKGYIGKPYGIRVLLTEVRRCLDG